MTCLVFMLNGNKFGRWAAVKFREGLTCATDTVLCGTFFRLCDFPHGLMGGALAAKVSGQ